MNLLETVLCLGILLVVLAGLTSFWQWSKENQDETLAAHDLKLITQIAKSYAEANLTTLYTSSHATSGVSFSTSSGLPLELKPYFTGQHQGKNIWGQSYQIAFRKQEIDAHHAHLLLFVYTEGGYAHTDHAKFKFKNIRSAAAKLKLSKDSSLSNNAYVLGGYLDDEGRLYSQTLSLDLSLYNLPNLKAGHLALVVTLLDTSSLQALKSGDYLYRTKVPEHPELNSMQVDLDMTGHNLNKVAGLGFENQSLPRDECDSDHLGRLYLQDSEDPLSHGLFICKKRGEGYAYEQILDSSHLVIKDVLLVANDTLVYKPKCWQGVPEIWVTPVALAQKSEETPPITAFQAYAENSQENYWRVKLRMQGPADTLWSFPEASVAQAQVLTLCRPSANP